MTSATLHEADGSSSTDGKVLSETFIVRKENEGRCTNDIQPGCGSPSVTICNRRCSCWGGQRHILRYRSSEHDAFTISRRILHENPTVFTGLRWVRLKKDVDRRIINVDHMQPAGILDQAQGWPLQKLAYEMISSRHFRQLWRNWIILLCGHQHIKSLEIVKWGTKVEPSNTITSSVEDS